MNETNNPKTRRLSLRGGLTALGVVALGATLAGCGGGGGGGSCPDTEIQVSWHLVQGGQVVECQPADTVTVQVDDSSVMTMSFACTDHGDLTPAVEGGVTHSISFTLSDGGGATLSQTSDMGLSVGCGGVTTAPEVEFDLQ